MSDWTLWLDIGMAIIALLGVALYLHARGGRRARLAARLRAEVDSPRSLGDASFQGERGVKGRGAAGLQRIGASVPLFDASQRKEMSGKLVSAGFRRPHALPVLIGLALMSGVVAGAAVVVFGWPQLPLGTLMKLLVTLVGVYVGMLLPRMILDYMVLRRQRTIEKSLPDALDLLVICTNSGLGLNTAMQRVAQEMESISPALGDELSLTASELQISSDASVALRGLADRTGLASVRALVGTLIQSRQYGTAITQALRVLARSERTARLMRLEEAAAKLATKITVPMMLFILPTVLMVAAGPAMLKLMEFFASQ